MIGTPVDPKDLHDGDEVHIVMAEVTEFGVKGLYVVWGDVQRLSAEDRAERGTDADYFLMKRANAVVKWDDIERLRSERGRSDEAHLSTHYSGVVLRDAIDAFLDGVDQ